MKIPHITFDFRFAQKPENDEHARAMVYEKAPLQLIDGLTIPKGTLEVTDVLYRRRKLNVHSALNHPMMNRTVTTEGISLRQSRDVDLDPFLEDVEDRDYRLAHMRWFLRTRDQRGTHPEMYLQIFALYVHTSHELSVVYKTRERATYLEQWQEAMDICTQDLVWQTGIYLNPWNTDLKALHIKNSDGKPFHEDGRHTKLRMPKLNILSETLDLSRF